MAHHPYLSHYHPAQEIKPPVKDKNLWQILGLINKASGVDLTHYKHSTIWRRIMRRMALKKIIKPEDYIRYLQENPGEVNNLYQDVLIKVTGFFRDPKVFEALKAEIFPLIQRQKSPGVPVRIWVPGCSTGEEAYSLAMSWLEYLGDQAEAAPIQVFATDVSSTVIEKARNGLYPENIAEDVSPDRLARFFVKTNGSLQVSKTVRDTCIFAQQNLIQDPPFSKLDLISCRNVLIYLEPVLQKRVLQIFHFALKPMGFLMVGASESIGQFPEFFSLENQKYKIYRRKAHFGPMPLVLGRRGLGEGMAAVSKLPGPGRGLEPERSLQGSGLPGAQPVCPPGGVGQRGDGNPAIPGGDGFLSKTGPGGSQFQPHEDGPEKPAHGTPHRHQRGPAA